MSPTIDPDQQSLDDERNELLLQLQAWLEVPMLVLSFVWLVLFVVELVWGLSPLLEVAGYLIWGAFLFDFLLGFLVAPRKGRFLASNWLAAIALLVPALRLFRFVRVLRAARLVRLTRGARGLRLVRVVGGLNRGMRAFGLALGRNGLGYMLGLTCMVVAIGAAGMYTFERDNADGRGLHTYGAALWWTAMLITTMGSEYWPQSAEGRVLCLLLSLYAFAAFGYVTAALATFFIGRDAAAHAAQVGRGEPAGGKELASLRAEIAALRDDIRQLPNRPASA